MPVLLSSDFVNLLAQHFHKSRENSNWSSVTGHCREHQPWQRKDRMIYILHYMVLVFWGNTQVSLPIKLRNLKLRTLDVLGKSVVGMGSAVTSSQAGRSLSRRVPFSSYLRQARSG